MRITRSSQEKLQNILKAIGFQVRYEKGNFQGGHCVVMEKRLIVINKFHPLESKISVLSDLVCDLVANGIGHASASVFMGRCSDETPKAGQLRGRSG